jgi:transcriptional regulator with XRE-family HTH domain
MDFEKIVSEEKHRELKAMEEKGDTQGATRWHFGVFITYMRMASDLTQEEAAERAGLSRVQWSRIENGHDLPKRETISAIADAINVDVGGLYRRADYAVPHDLKIYDLRRAKKALECELLESTSLAEFLTAMQMVWQEFQLQRLGKHQRRYIDPAYAQITAHLYESFSQIQRINFCKEILLREPKGKVDIDPNHPHRFFDQLDAWVITDKEDGEAGTPPA